MRRVLAETDTKTTETGGIQVNVASESDKTDASVDGVTTEGCINAADC